MAPCGAPVGAHRALSTVSRPPPTSRRRGQLLVAAWALSDLPTRPLPPPAPRRGAPPPPVHLPGGVATTYLHDAATGAQCWIVPTAHVGDASAREVRAVIAAVRPHVLVVELCPARLRVLLAARQAAAASPGPAPAPRAPPLDAAFVAATAARLLRPPPGSGPGAEALSASLAGLYRAAGAAGHRAGAEFAAAVEAAAASAGCRVAAGDRDLGVTLARVAAALGPADLLRLGAAAAGGDAALRPPAALAAALEAAAAPGGGGLVAGLEALRGRRAAAALVAWLRRLCPGATAALIDERDALLAAALAGEGGAGRRIVAVMGAAHVAGVEREWRALVPGGVVVS